MEARDCSCRKAGIAALDRLAAIAPADLLFGERRDGLWLIDQACGAPASPSPCSAAPAPLTFHSWGGVADREIEAAILAARRRVSHADAAIYANHADRFAAIIAPQSAIAPDVVFQRAASLAHAAVSVALQSTLLRATERPTCTQSAFDLSVDALARVAGRRVLDAALNSSGFTPAPDLYDVFCDVATAEYEGRTHEATIVLGVEGEGPAPSLSFRRPVETWERAGVRKLIEMASDHFALLFDGRRFHGFTTLTDQPSGVSVRIKGRGVWALHHGPQMTALFSHGLPVERQRILTLDVFEKYLLGVFESMPDVEVSRLWEIVTVAAEQPVGTNILFTAAAAQEAARLARQCIPVEPTVLTPELTRRLTSIDGTLIVDTFGAVHAVGAILDGRSTAEGTWQRGGRYNSAANFVTSCGSPCFILIVSQDRYIDVLPPVGAGDATWAMRRYLKLSSTAI